MELEDDSELNGEFQIEAHDMLDEAEDALLSIETSDDPEDNYNIAARY